MLKLAREKHPDVVFHHGDMVTFKLEKRFDVITCLFSAIGHLKTKRRLDTAVRNMALHAKPGGLVIVEPWLTPKNYSVGRLGANFVDLPKLKIARIGISKARGRLSVRNLHHLVGSPDRVEHFVEKVVMGLFTHEEYLDSFRSARLDVEFDPEGLMGRGLYLGTSTVAAVL
jgi:SAM-dependent methyltransferase